MRNDRMPGFLQKLTRLCGYEKALPMNTGVEAVETAIKLARRWGYDVKGIAGRSRARSSCSPNNFHGRTISGHQREHDAGVPHALRAVRAGIRRRTVSATPARCRARDHREHVRRAHRADSRRGRRQRSARRIFEARCARSATSIACCSWPTKYRPGFGRTGDMFACDYERVKSRRSDRRQGARRRLLPGLRGARRRRGDGPLPARRSRQHVRRQPARLRRRASGRSTSIVAEDLPARARRAGAAIVAELRAIKSAGNRRSPRARPADRRGDDRAGRTACRTHCSSAGWRRRTRTATCSGSRRRSSSTTRPWPTSSSASPAPWRR